MHTRIDISYQSDQYLQHFITLSTTDMTYTLSSGRCDTSVAIFVRSGVTSSLDRQTVFTCTGSYSVRLVYFRILKEISRTPVALQLC